MNNAIKRASMLAIAAIVALGAWAEIFVEVTGTDVRLRMKPSLNAATLIDANTGQNIHPKKGDRLPYLGEAGDFNKVNYNGYVVYISKQFSRRIDTEASQAATPTAQVKRVVVDGEHVRLRLQPSLQAGVLTIDGKTIYPEKGDALVFMADAGDFYKVNFRGYYVYISKQFSHLQK